MVQQLKIILLIAPGSLCPLDYILGYASLTAVQVSVVFCQVLSDIANIAWVPGDVHHSLTLLSRAFGFWLFGSSFL